MAFKQGAIPNGVLRARGERAVSGIRRRAGCQVLVVGTMEIHRGEVILLDVELADQARSVEGLIANSCARNTESGIIGNSASIALGELKIRGSLADVSECADALQSKTSDLKCLAESEIAIVGPVCRQTGTAIIGT